MSSTLRAITGALRRTFSAPPAAARDRRQVRLLADAATVATLTPEERLITRTLAAAEVVTVEDVLRHVSQLLYREESQRGGWSVDIGMFGPRVFAPDVARALAGGNGRLWTITSPAS